MIQIAIPKHLEEAFIPGFSYRDAEKNEYDFYLVTLGLLHVTEGKLIACDPFLYHQEKPFSATFPAGRFPVELAIAKCYDDERIAFARIKFTEKKAVRWTMAHTREEDLAHLEPGDIYGFGVDSGSGCYMDLSGARQYGRFLNECEDNYTKVIAEKEQTYQHTRSWMMWEKNGNNVAMFSTGWGDGFYASYIGYDADGNICRLVSDLGVIGD